MIPLGRRNINFVIRLNRNRNRNKFVNNSKFGIRKMLGSKDLGFYVFSVLLENHDQNNMVSSV